jgi:hypothetical protein
MKKLHKNQAARQEAYRERLSEKQAIAAEQASEIASMKALNLCGFSEVAFNTPARTCAEEIQVHRSWLRALEQSDVLPGETLRQLAKRTWDSLLASEGYSVDIDGGSKWVVAEDGSKQWQRGFDVFYPLFSPSLQHFQVPFDSIRYPGGPFCEAIRDGATPGWFDANWRPPKDCTGDEPIDVAKLPALPPMRQQKPAPEVKPERTVVEQPTDFVYVTPPRSGLGTFGVTRTSHV